MRRARTGVVAVLALVGALIVVQPTSAAPETAETTATAGSAGSAAAGSAAAPAAGQADPAPAAPGVGAGALDTRWAGETVALAWDGTTYTTADRSFVGVPVTVPGDRAVRTVSVRNDGPTTGTLRAWVQEVDLQGPVTDEFYDDLQLDWTSASASGAASFRALAEAGRTQVAQVELAPGQSTPLTVGYTFPASSTSGNRAEVGARAASFVVHLEIRGETPGDHPAGTGAQQPAGRPGVLAMTGADLLRAALLAVGAVGVGSLLLAGTRRRRRSARGAEGPPTA
ncbi:hypothetical protein [Cellulomonas shaoxiangyii]|uniref:Peptidase n=1 Tax=Cellulomonas shaoxiangyii TaxID=2566013 RepID=A0A4P7SLZ3_9CELL|nr:hypothetical protein [Cellulomonas shaoxiangyii]QCB93854.1 hypothetical protein E5225_10085 [Cellulomonas shaoxiangyii]TGY84587.1 hypothetical protein E5226_10575 [Cellulomonas shaoxiangyii]